MIDKDYMEEINLKVTAEDSGKRVDKYIAGNLGKEYSRMYVKYLITENFVFVNGKEVKPSYMLHENDEIHLKLAPSPEIKDVIPEDIPLDIIYEDDTIIVVNKSAGMVVHPAAGNKTGTLVNALLFHCGALPDADDLLRPGVVHRLDKDTSGVMVVAKTSKALRSLAKQFQNRTIKKTYLAFVEKRVELDNGIVDAPLGRHSVDRKKMDIEHVDGKNARTVYHVIQRYDDFTFLRLEPETGRTHQIRVHMKYLGYPIIGDQKYGKGQGMDRQALHAESLEFTHPKTGKKVKFSVSMPEDMKEFMEKMKRD